MKVAFIGIGNMGKPMASNIAKHGHEVFLFDANPASSSRVAKETGGDDPAAIETVKPILACMGTTLFEVGKLGSGHAAKALNTVAAAGNYAVLAFNTGFTTGLLAKDANIAAELSQGLGCNSPHIELTGRRWAEARDSLGESADNSKAMLAWAKNE